MEPIMKKFVLPSVLVFFLAFFSLSSISNDNPVLKLQTSMGDIIIELYPDKAPETVKNFMQYVNEGFYKDTIFHRVIDGFMIQGGGFNKDYSKKQAHPAIGIESDNGLNNNRGTIAMARTMDPNSATSQFFINLSDNHFLNYKNSTRRGYGYAVFGKVTQGIEIVDKIGKVETKPKNIHQNAPIEPITIINTTLELTQ